MGAAIAAAARTAGQAEVFWCQAGRSKATAGRAAEAGIRPLPDLGALLSACDVVLAICPPAAAEELADEVAVAGFDGVYVEANAISVARAERIAYRLNGAGVRIVDGAIIGPPPVAGRSARLYLAGPEPESLLVADMFSTGPVEAVLLPRSVGAASALKMAYASYQKTARTLAAVAHALAARYGLTDQLLEEAHRLTISPLADPGYTPGVAARAWRWGPEMHEVADTLAAAGLPTDLATAAAAVLGLWEDDRDNWDISLDSALGRLASETTYPAANPPPPSSRTHS
jgi:3-hydroxyisobutyrate dehydrogenase-like beta-hydroxyacid dehydrogenase